MSPEAAQSPATTAQTPPARVTAIPGSVWRVAAVVIVGAFMTQLDSALVNVGLETVARDLHASLQTTNWIVSAYLVALVMGLPLCGWASRRIGASQLWLWALGSFTVASLLCAWSPNIQALIGFRAVQGFAGGLLLPAGQTVIAQVSGRELMGRVMSTAGMALVLGPALGPVVGGLLIVHASWPWLFLVNVPVGVVGLWLGLRLMPRAEARQPASFDTVGFLLVGLALPAITYAVSRIGQPDAATVTVGIPLLAGLAALTVFGWRCLHRGTPLLQVQLFTNQIFSAAAVASLLAGAIQFGALVIWALYFQSVRGYGVVETGLAMIGFAVGAATLPITGWFTDRFGGGPVAVAGAVLTTATFVPMSLLSHDVGLVPLEACLLLLGIGNALSVVPASTVAYVSIDRNAVPDAVTLINIFLRLGGAIGAALLVAVLGTGSAARSSAAPFHAAFWCLTAISGLSVITTLVLRSVSRPARKAAASR